MKTKNTKKGSKKTEVKAESAPLGLRGLKALVFNRFDTAFKKSKDLSKLPTMEELTKEVAEKFPQSRWIARPKVHYSYYKSKFISSQKAA